MSDRDTRTTDGAADVAAEDPRVRQVELAISRLLRVGVVTSLSLLALGTVLSFVQPGGYGGAAADVARLTGSAGSFPRTPAWLAEGWGRLSGQAVIVTGLLVLIATPVLRVAVSIAAFVIQRDRVFVWVTAVVLALLVLSFVVGAGG